MIAIPNMDKPKTCENCPCAYFTEGAYTDECQVTHNHITDEKPTDCPLIEIEDTEYEWCHECKEYDQEKHCCHRWSRVIRKTVADLEEHYGKHITKHDQTLVIDYPNTDDIQTILLMDDEGFTRVFKERRSDVNNTERD